jgi:hypothetical protein
MYKETAAFAKERLLFHLSKTIKIKKKKVTLTHSATDSSCSSH